MFIIIIIIIILLILILNKENFNLVKIFDDMFNKRTHYMFSEKEEDEEDIDLMYKYDYELDCDRSALWFGRYSD